MDYLINMKGMKMEEYNILQTTIQANLDVMKMCDTSNDERKDIILLSIMKELKILCENIIPIFEEKIKSDLKD
tara:strand:+ start:17 stop:235 length:219 start_codon:yes stop_codon:yes gene_type:complete